MAHSLLARTLSVLRAALALVAGLCLAIGLTTGSAAAQDDGGEEEEPTGLLSLPSKAQDRFKDLADECVKVYSRDRFEEAEELCLEAEAITPHPLTFYARARIRHKTDRCLEAMELYKFVLETPPAGRAEAKWLDDYRERTKKHLTSLDECRARIKVACDDENAIVQVGEQLVSGCPAEVVGVIGPQPVTVLAPGKEPGSREVTGIGGELVEVEFEALPEQSDEGVPIELDCSALDAPAIALVDGTPVGPCGSVVRIPPGRTRIDAVDVDGERGMAMVDADPQADPQADPANPEVAVISTLRPVELDCTEPTRKIRVRLFGDSATFLEGPCEELAQGGGKGHIEIPDGAHEIAIVADADVELPVPFEIDGEPDAPVRVPALDEIPVETEVVCEDEAGPPVYVRIGKEVGICPFQTELPVGAYKVEARQEDHEPWEGEFTLTHDSPRIDIPRLDETSFWSAGSITTLSAGALLITALAIDLAGLQDLCDLKGLRGEDAFYCSDPDLTRDPNELVDTVETNIILTRVFYGAALVTGIVGASLWIWEAVSADPDAFAEEVGAVHVSPMLTPRADGAGLSLRIRF